MGDWYIGEIRTFPMNWAPDGWHLCDGTQMQIQQNAALYTLIGTQFGGNGSTNFNLPDLRGRVPFGTGYSAATGVKYVQGQASGTETVTLSQSQLLTHNHSMVGLSSNGTQAPITNNVPAVSVSTSSTTPTADPVYGAVANMVQLMGDTVTPTGGAPHNNIQPYAVVNYCIAVSGLYPPRT